MPPRTTAFSIRVVTPATASAWASSAAGLIMESHTSASVVPMALTAAEGRGEDVN